MNLMVRLLSSPNLKVRPYSRKFDYSEWFVLFHPLGKVSAIDDHRSRYL